MKAAMIHVDSALWLLMEKDTTLNLWAGKNCPTRRKRFVSIGIPIKEYLNQL